MAWTQVDFPRFEMGPMSFIHIDGEDPLYLGTIVNALELGKDLHKRAWAILNCTDDPGLNDLDRPGFTICNLYHRDGLPYEIGQIHNGINFIKTSFELGSAVLVCCHAGMSRSPGMVLAYLMSTGLTYNQALRKILVARPIIQIHPKIDLSVRQYFHLAPRTAADLIGG